MGQACPCLWLHLAYECIFCFNSGAGIPAAGKRVGWGCHGDPQAWVPRDTPCILRSLPPLIAGGECDSPLNISWPSKIGCSAPATGCGDRRHLGGCRVGRLRGTTFCVLLGPSAPVTPSCYLLHFRAPFSCLFRSVLVLIPALSLDSCVTLNNKFQFSGRRVPI